MSWSGGGVEIGDARKYCLQVSGHPGVVTRPAETYLGIDLGTSGLKLTMIGGDGSILAESEASYALHAPRAGFAEVDPMEWAVALESAAQQLAGGLTSSHVDPPRAIGVTGQMHGVVLTDAAGKPMRPAILWPDQRAAECLDQWTGLESDVRGRLSNPIVSGMPGPVLSWLQEHEPESLRASSYVTFPKDWLRGLLTGDRVTERSDASATLLWDVVSDDWSSEALRLAAVATEQLPPVVPSTAPVGSVGDAANSQFFERLGWSGVPVVAGGSDVACALAALQRSASVDDWSKTVVVNVGTGVQIIRRDVKPAARPDAVTHLYADANGGWYEMVAVQNGGLALSWVQQLLGLSWEDFVAAARSAPAGSRGATFSPFLTGERGLLAAPDSTGGWAGLTPSVGRAELARSAFEALAFVIRQGVEALNPSAESVVLTGGGARDPWIRQLISEVLGQSLAHVPLRSASAVGAAVLAARRGGSSLGIGSKSSA